MGAVRSGLALSDFSLGAMHSLFLRVEEDLSCRYEQIDPASQRRNGVPARPRTHHRRTSSPPSRRWRSSEHHYQSGRKVRAGWRWHALEGGIVSSRAKPG